MTSYHADIAVIGAGPAGLAAAATAASRGARVVLIDENPSTGGQIWRGAAVGEHARWRDLAVRHNVHIHTSTTLFSIQPPAAPLTPFTLRLAHRARGTILHAARLILATGARELLLPFAGWTTPGVLGAGGLQAMIKGGLNVQSKRTVIAGSGPLLLAVAQVAREAGVHVVVLAEQASLGAHARAAVSLLQAPTKWAQAADLAIALRGIPTLRGWWPIRAHARRSVLSALELTNGRERRVIECDLAGVGFGLVPNTRVAAMLGCEIRGNRVRTDHHQRTSVPNIWCAGEATGIGGVDAAVLEGQIAACSATDSPQDDTILAQRDRARRFVSALNDALALRPELKHIAPADEFLCRCEDVRVREARAHVSWRDAKLQTRCGMGECQGRTCGPAAAFLFDWIVADTRPPLTPVSLGAILDTLSPAVDHPHHGASR